MVYTTKLIEKYFFLSRYNKLHGNYGVEINGPNLAMNDRSKIRQWKRLFARSTTFDYTHVPDPKPPVDLNFALALGKSRNIKHLNISNSNLHPDIMPAIVVALLKIRTVTILDLSNNKLLDPDVLPRRNSWPRKTYIIQVSRLISANVPMTCLILNNTNLDSIDIKTLTTALTYNTTLRSLHLSENHIGESGATYVANILRTNTSLETLWLNGCDLGQESARFLAEALIHNVTLQCLHISHASIYTGAARFLANMLRHNVTLKMLDLSGDPINNKGADHFIKVMDEENHTLIHLLLDINNPETSDRHG